MSTQEAAVRVVLADNQHVSRVGTRAVLEEAGITVVAETGSGAEALRLCEAVQPDVLVTEMALQDLSGLQVAVRLAERDSPVRVLILSAYEEERYIRHLLENGIAGYLKKQEAPRRIVEAVRGVARGEEGWLSELIGDWSGDLTAGAQRLRLVLHVSESESGRLQATLDSPSQNALGIPVSQIAQDGNKVKFAVSSIGSTFSGVMSESRSSISGDWTQGGQSFPIRFERTNSNP